MTVGEAQLLVGLSALLLLSSCFTFGDNNPPLIGSGETVEDLRELDPFREVVIRTDGEISILPSETYNASVQIDSNLVPHLSIEVVDDTLLIELDTSVRSSNLSIEIYAPQIDRLRHLGSATVFLRGRGTVESLDILHSGSGRILLETIAGQSVTTADSSVFVESGTSKTWTHRSRESGVFGAPDFAIAIARVGMNGESEAELLISETLVADVYGASILRYRGEPKIVEDVRDQGSLQALR